MKRWAVGAVGLGLVGVCWGGVRLAASLRAPADASSTGALHRSEARGSERGPDAASRALAIDARTFLSPQDLGAVDLGMDVASLGNVRPRIQRQPSADVEASAVASEPAAGASAVASEPAAGASGVASPHHTAGHKVFVEALGPGRRAVYLFDARSAELVGVQVAAGVGDAEAFIARLAGWQASFGVPDGIWDCGLPDGEGLPTRRFTWRRGRAAAMDTIHVLPKQILATLYVASQATISESLRRGACKPTAKEDFARFPAIALSATEPE